jgi:hypothetical protein
MSIRYNLAMLQTRADRDPQGRAARFLARGHIEGKFLVIDEVTHWEVLGELPQSVPWRFDPTRLQRWDGLRPVGFVEFVLKHARLDRGELILDRAAHAELERRFYPASRPNRSLDEPSPIEIARNFTAAVAAWAEAGFEVVGQAEYERRRATCIRCEHWDPAARMGTGKCRKCGCSGLKLWLATATCPDAPPRW